MPLAGNTAASLTSSTNWLMSSVKGPSSTISEESHEKVGGSMEPTGFRKAVWLRQRLEGTDALRHQREGDPESLRTGDLVFIRYKDHVLFKDAAASEYQPWTRET